MRSEGCRVLELVRAIQAQALALRDVVDVSLVAEIDAAVPAIAQVVIGTY